MAEVSMVALLILQPEASKSSRPAKAVVNETCHKKLVSPGFRWLQLKVLYVM